MRTALERTGGVAGLLLVLTVLVFSLLHLAPGSPEQLLLGRAASNPVTVEAFRARLALDQSLPAQYLDWLGGAIQLDFGTSFRSGEDVLGVVTRALGVTLHLTLLAVPLTLAIGLPLGVLAAQRRGTGWDRFVVGTSALGISAPPFVTSIVLIYVFAAQLRWFPSFGGGEGFLDRTFHLVLPALALAVLGVGFVVRLTRAALADVLDADYIAFARARGVDHRRVLLYYGVRNALIPVLSGAGVLVAVFTGGAILVETAFGLPGSGRQLVQALGQQDLALVQGTTFIVAVIIVVLNLTVDALYRVVDPRTRHGA